MALGGEGGIRTRGYVTASHAFQACAFDHSTTSPWRAMLDNEQIITDCEEKSNRFADNIFKDFCLRDKSVFREISYSAVSGFTREFIRRKTQTAE